MEITWRVLNGEQKAIISGWRLAGMFSRRVIRLLILEAFVLGALAQPQSQGQTTSSTTASTTTSSDSTEKYYFFGTVVLDDGTPPPIGTAIELDCQRTLTRVADVTLNGQYSFLLGDSERTKQLLPDASIANEDPFNIPASTTTQSTQSSSSSSTQTATQSSAQSSSTQSSSLTETRLKLVACELRAQLAGYRSSVVKLQDITLSPMNTVATIVVYPVTKILGKSISATSLNAPKKARKSLDQAAKAYKKEDLNEAVLLLQSAVAEYPNYAEAWFQLGVIYQKQQRYKEAHDALKQAVAADKMYIAPYVQLGWVAIRESKWREAADATDQALALDPLSFPEAYYLSALAHFNLNNRLKAEQRARQMQQFDSKHQFPRTYLILAHILAEKKDYAGAVDGFRNYLKYAPNASDAEAVRKQLQENEKLAKK
jgi:tetratricopeptide (TPR) repeat protein